MISYQETPEDILRYNQPHLKIDLLWGVKEGQGVQGYSKVSNCGDQFAYDAWSTLGQKEKSELMEMWIREEG